MEFTLGFIQNTFRAILFSIPFIVLPLSIFTLSFFPWYIGLLAFAGLMWGMMQTVTGLLGKHAHKVGGGVVVPTGFPRSLKQLPSTGDHQDAVPDGYFSGQWLLRRFHVVV